uniref:RRM domain-containing protein n=1 Tax=Oryza punctata TaxID=4537 RepID=A0A0E0LHU2_ORYPU
MVVHKTPPRAARRGATRTRWNRRAAASPAISPLPPPPPQPPRRFPAAAALAAAAVRAHRPPRSGTSSRPPLATPPPHHPHHLPPTPAVEPTLSILASTPPTPPQPTEPSTASPPVVDDAAARSSALALAAARKVRKVVKTVIVKKIVPKGTFAARKAAAVAAAVAAAAAVAGVASSETGGETPTDDPASDQDGGVGNDRNLDESVGEKPPTNCNAVAVLEEPVCEEVMVVEKPAEPTSDCGVDGCVGEGVVSKGVEMEEARMSERQKRMTMEVFVGGLHRDAKEDDVRAVFAKAGEITEVRMIMNPLAGKNKGYCFVRYRDAVQAKKAITEFSNVKICGKLCRAAAPVGNDRIFLGNINKKWKKQDVIKLLKKMGIENIDSVTLMSDSNNPVYNRGFAFLELETSRDARMAYKKLSQKNAFGKGLNIRVAWAEPLNDPDEKDMQVKSIFVDGIPTSWDHAELKEIFKKHGKIESVVLSRDMPSAKRKDFAFINYITHEAAISCLESFDKEEFSENDSKVNIKVSLAKPAQQSKQIKEDHKSKIRYPVQDYTHIYSGEKRPFSTLNRVVDSFSLKHFASSYVSYGALPPATAESSLPHYHDSSRYPPHLGEAIKFSPTSAVLSKQAWQKMKLKSASESNFENYPRISACCDIFLGVLNREELLNNHSTSSTFLFL